MTARSPASWSRHARARQIRRHISASRCDRPPPSRRVLPAAAGSSATAIRRYETGDERPSPPVHIFPALGEQRRDG